MSGVLVVGHGMASARLVEQLVLRGVADVTVVGDEPHGAYNRVLLSGVLAGTLAPSDLTLRPRPWYADRGVRVRSGLRVAAVDRRRRRVLTETGEAIAYEHLVLATGSRPYLPPIRGVVSEGSSMNPGVFSFRTLSDCEHVLAAARPGLRVVVIGGGLLGLEAARGLQARGLSVEVVHQGTHLMDRQLDVGAGAMLRRTLTRLGIPSYVEARAVSVTPGGPTGVRGVRLADGYELVCDLVVFACGIRPSIALARGAGLEVRSGVVVDDRLSTSDPSISALGECAQHEGGVSGYVHAAWEQADVLAAVLAGHADARYGGSRQVSRLRAAGVEVAAMGETTALADADTQLLRLADPVRETYKLAVVRHGRLVGALLVGDLSTVATVTRAFDRGTPLPADRAHLLFGEKEVA